MFSVMCLQLLPDDGYRLKTGCFNRNSHSGSGILFKEDSFPEEQLRLPGLRPYLAAA